MIKSILSLSFQSSVLLLGFSLIVSTAWSFTLPRFASTKVPNHETLLPSAITSTFTSTKTGRNYDRFRHSSSSSPSSCLRVLTSPMETENMPELGSDGVFHIMNESQHRALLEANKDKLVVMKVFAPWCRACKGLEPKFNAIVKDKKYQGLPLIWTDLTIQHNKEYVKKIGVLALPTIQFYAHGQIMDTFACGPSKVPILKRKLAQFINQNIYAKTLTVKPLSEVLSANETATAAAAAATAASLATSGETSLETALPFDDEDEDESSSMVQDGQGVPVAASSLSPTTAAMAQDTIAPEELSVEKVVQKLKSNLRRIIYFSGMLESEFDALLGKAKLLTFESGSIIMKEGNMGRTFYVIVDGEVEICQRTSFEDPLTTPPTYLGTVINRFEKGDFFGERALITGEPRAASIRASSRTRCLAFDKDDFPPSCVLSGKAKEDSKDQELQSINERYGVALADMTSMMSDRQFIESVKANQIRGSFNSPQVIDGVDNDKPIIEIEDDVVAADGELPKSPMQPTSFGSEPEIIVPLLMRFKLIRLVTRCFDYIVSNRPRLDQAQQRRRNMLINLLSKSQRVDFTDAYKLIDKDEDGVITLLELRRLMDSIGEEKSDDELVALIQASNYGDGNQVLTYQEFMGLMAEVEFYNLFLETFRALDKQDSGFVRAKDLDRVLCGVRDLITDDRRSIIDVEDTEMMVDYEQFSRMLLGTALK